MRPRHALVLLALVPVLASGASGVPSGCSAAAGAAPSSPVALAEVSTAAPGPAPAGTADMPLRRNAAATRRPNIVMVMADDMRMDDLRFAPNVRRLVGARGVTFANSFSPYPLCCPARASFLTGQYAHNHHVFSHVEPYGFGAFDDSFTIATALRRGGYNTGFVGKYLNNYGRDPSLVTGGPSWRYVPAGWTDWEAAVEPGPGSPATGSTYNYFNTSFNIDGHIDNGHRGEYQTDVLGRMGVRLVRKYAAARKPFFLYFSSVAPHHGAPDESDDPGLVRRPDGEYTAFDTPARPDWVKGRFDAVVRRSPGLPADGGVTEADMSDKPRYLRRLPSLSAAERAALTEVTRQRAEAVYVLDRQVGRLVRTLRRTGAYRDTVIMFTSDNGYFLGEHRVRQGKTKPHEPSLRVPFLVAGPGIPAGQVRYDPISTPDITATIADLGRVSARLTAHHPADGTSKLATIRRGDRGWTIPVVTEAMQWNPYGRVKNAERGFLDARDSIGIRTSRYKYVRYSTGDVEVYDLDVDPNELRSVQADPAYRRVRRGLARIWSVYKDCRGATCTAPMAERFQTAPAQTRAGTRRQDRGVVARNGLGY